MKTLTVVLLTAVCNSLSVITGVGHFVQHESLILPKVPKCVGGAVLAEDIHSQVRPGKLEIMSV